MSAVLNKVPPPPRELAPDVPEDTAAGDANPPAVEGESFSGSPDKSMSEAEGPASETTPEPSGTPESHTGSPA